MLGLGEDAYPVSVRDAIEARPGRKVSCPAAFITRVDPVLALRAE